MNILQCFGSLKYFSHSLSKYCLYNLVQCYNASKFSLTRDVTFLNSHFSEASYDCETRKRNNIY